MEGMDFAGSAAAFVQILFINLVLSGDNAVVVGMAAAGLPDHLRGKAILFGMAAATILRLLFAVVAVQLLNVIGLKLIGGALLFWIAWKMWQEIREEEEAEADPSHKAVEKTLGTAMFKIIVADVSMSLDNVLAVAAAAHGRLAIMIGGLACSILFMGLAAAAIAKLLQRFHWIAYVGLALIVYVAGDMTWEGIHEVWGYFKPA